MDTIGKAERSRVMSRIRGRNTGPEMAVRRALFDAGLRYRLHRRDLPGSPDIVMAGRRIAIFVHGCFWHRHRGCSYATQPKTNAAFWKSKLRRNQERDQSAVKQLRDNGWRVLTVWECSIKRRVSEETLQERLVDWVNGGLCVGDIAGVSGGDITKQRGSKTRSRSIAS